MLATMLAMPFAALAQSDAPVIPGIVREQLRERAENIRSNEDYRNNILENRARPASGTMPIRPAPMAKPPMTQGVRDDVRARIASSSDRAEAMAERREELREKREEIQAKREEMQAKRETLRMDLFNKHKENLVRQLDRAIENLKQVQGRINERITKAEQSGRNMSEAKALLVTALQKIQVAESAITSLKTYQPASSSLITASSTGTNDADVNILKARQVGENAIKAVKDARESLNLVVRAIAQNMGLKLSPNATSTNATSTSATTTSTN